MIRFVISGVEFELEPEPAAVLLDRATQAGAAGEIILFNTSTDDHAFLGVTVGAGIAIYCDADDDAAADRLREALYRIEREGAE